MIPCLSSWQSHYYTNYAILIVAWYLNAVLNDTSWRVTHLHPETRVPSKYFMAQIEQAPARNEKCVHKWLEGKVTHGADELHSVKNVKNNILVMNSQWHSWELRMVWLVIGQTIEIITVKMLLTAWYWQTDYLPTHPPTNYIQQSSLRTNQSLAIQENPLHPMEPKGSLLHLQMPTTCPDPQPDAPVHAHPSSIMLSSYL